MRVTAVLALIVAFAAAQDNWAILVAGSNGYYNYRHQSDIYHAYQILTKKGGFPAERVIVFHYDDIATSSSNPKKGQVFNHPSLSVNNYVNVPKDYTGSATTAANLLSAMLGRDTGGRKVLKSGPNDRVFFYFSDHGATGLVAMPVGPYLYAKDLMQTVQQMHNQKMYKEMVMYIEACESGSMFDGVLPSGVNVYGTSASNPYESSYAWYYSSEVQAYLGDEYSIQWMEHSDASDFGTTSVEAQFKVVKQKTTMSHPMEYGDSGIAAEMLKNFQAYKQGAALVPLVQDGVVVPGAADKVGRGVDSRDVKLDVITRRWLAATGEDKVALEEEMRAEVASREFHDKTMTSVVAMSLGANELVADIMTGRFPLTDHVCQKTVVEHYRTTCGFTDYSLKYVRQLVNLCEAGVEADTITAAISHHC